MSASSSVRRIPRTLFVLAIIGVIPTVASCTKKADPVIIDAGPPPAPVETVTQLVAMEEDAGTPDADAEAGPVFRGPAVNPNVARIKACCAALASQGKSQANTPEGQMVLNAAAQCSAGAAHLAPNGTAPELAVMRTMLVGKTIPPICQGL